MRRALTILLFVCAIGSAFAAYMLAGSIALLTATARAGRTAVWVRTPHVAPGDTMTLDVGAKGGERIGIASVIVRAGDRELAVSGEGNTWGPSFTSRRNSEGQDDLQIQVQIPKESIPGRRLPVTIAVAWIAAESDGMGRFSNANGTDALVIDVPILTPTSRTLHRLGSAGWALLLLAAACAALALLGKLLGPVLRRKDDGGNAEPIALLLLVALFGYGFVGYAWFAAPLVAATHLVGLWFTVVAVVAWIAIPLYVAVKLERRRRAYVAYRIRAIAVSEDTPYRAPPDSRLLPERTVEPRPLADVIAAVRAAGLAVKPRRKGFDVRQGGSTLQARVKDPARVSPAGLAVRSTDIELHLDLAFALVPLFGAVAAETGSFGELVIDGRRTREEIGAELHARVRGAAQHILDRLKATQPLLDQISKQLRR